MLGVVRMALPSAALVLYYHPYSFYSQKVVMTLHEKKIRFEPVTVDITRGEQYTDSYLKINAKGEVPVLQDDGKLIADSVRIIDYIEDNFTNGSTPLMPFGNNTLRVKTEQFRNMIDVLPAGIITMGSFFHPKFCENPKLPFVRPVRSMLKSGEMNSAKNLRSNADLNPTARDVLMKKADLQDKKHLIIINENEYKKVLDSVEEVLEKVENELAQNDAKSKTMWLISEDFTIADISLAILLVRLDTLGLDNYFWSNGKRINIENYYKRIQKRQSFMDTIPDYRMHLKIFLNSMSPLTLGIGVLGSIGIIAGTLLILKRLLV